MADANVQGLQLAVNRYAAAAGFAPIGVDGGVGDQTRTAVLSALNWINLNVAGSQQTVIGLLQRIAVDHGAQDYAQITASAAGLATYLNQNADAAGLPAAAPGAYAGGGGGGGGSGGDITMPQMNVGAGATNLVNKVKGLPTWTKLLGGVLAAFGMVYAYKKYKSSAQLMGLSDMYLVDHETGQKVRRATQHEIAWFHHKGRIDLPNPAARGGGVRRYDVIDA